MKDYRKAIINPIITEKSAYSKTEIRTYVFEVADNVNKVEIKHAVEKMFNVKVGNVRTLNVLGKVKRSKFGLGKRKDKKKAYVTLKKNQRIELFEGA
ncbi:MAG: 50S ribosomal protein L23 [bacterium (Candidatus Stahlbacteria) CG23_combo_of_CG06-09_8_20_14_all_34_7]|nr:MAG: 50S ribosomal protein L23 [bacterium (Candidatus Stahlbacteria) CG23_combo_of_CG06-09_8_20_14_all_34_7]